MFPSNVLQSFIFPSLFVRSSSKNNANYNKKGSKKMIQTTKYIAKTLTNVKLSSVKHKMWTCKLTKDTAEREFF
jgi:hypothetical protein